MGCGHGRFAPVKVDKTSIPVEELANRVARLRGTKLFAEMSDAELDTAARMLEARSYARGACVFDQGDEGVECYVVDVGQCVGKVKTLRDVWLPVKDYEPGFAGFFGERALLRNEPRTSAVFARSKEVRLYALSRAKYTELIKERDLRENLIRGAKLFESMTDDQVAKLASALERRAFSRGAHIIRQGYFGEHFFILEAGEAVCVKESHGSEQQVYEYGAGGYFGEIALMETKPRAASIVAKTECTCYLLGRHAFEERLGPLSQLKAEQYLAHPCKLLADFYRRGDARGPRGMVEREAAAGRGPRVPDAAAPSDWFVVYRPTSRDSIAKMLGRVGVGKGLNVKGKSAKKNRLSGFVPFLQINDNAHKREIEESPPHTRVRVYWRSEKSRSEAYGGVAKVLVAMCRSEDPKLAMDAPDIRFLDDHKPAAWGMDLPERLVREAFVMRPDISPMVGWEVRARIARAPDENASA